MHKLLFLLFAAFAVAQEDGFPKVKWMDPVRDIQVRPRTVHSQRIDVDGGRPAQVGEVTYQAGILANHAIFCGGSLITESAILTTASCIDGRNFWEIHLGIVKLVTTVEEEMSRRVIQSSHAVIHEQYDVMTNANAVGIIRLPGPVAYSKYVKPIRLPRLSQRQDWQVKSEPTVVSGWGISYRGEMDAETHLKVIETNIVSNDECSSIYGADTILDSMLCVENGNLQLASCFGDAGGPIVLDEDGIPVQVGIVLWGPKQQCKQNLPEIAIRTAPFVEWIAAHGGPAVRP